MHRPSAVVGVMCSLSCMLIASCGLTDKSRDPISGALPVGNDAPASSALAALRHGHGPFPEQRLLYISDYGAGDVAWYTRRDLDKGPIGTITHGVSGPDGIFLDRNGALFVTNNVNTSRVDVYPPNATKPSRTYTKALDYPDDVVVDSNGAVYVANIGDYGRSGTVVEYAPGSDTPSSILRPGGSAYGLALDPSDNLYVLYQPQPSGPCAIKEYRFGSKIGYRLPNRAGASQSPHFCNAAFHRPGRPARLTVAVTTHRFGIPERQVARERHRGRQRSGGRGHNGRVASKCSAAGSSRR
jgi:hypothetical protein